MTTKTKHTPGPWSVDPDFDAVDDGDYTREVFDDPEQRLVATVHGDTAEEAAANARLIAAAPDLLEACKAALAIFDERRDKYLPRGISDDEFADTVLRPAIAKAEGGEN